MTHMINEYNQSLTACPLFACYPKDETAAILRTTAKTVHTYKAGALIASEADHCTAIGIVLAGSIAIQKNNPDGQSMSITHLQSGSLFGEAVLFSQCPAYPATVVADTAASIMFISSSEILRLCQKQPQILQNFMRILSDKLLMLNKKIQDLSLGTIHSRLCHFLLEEYKRQKVLTLIMPLSKKALAEDMGIQRPSLSREFSSLKQSGLIDFTKDTITITNLAAIKAIAGE